jgi:sigma-B regulation protein RsbU (phosphoserine phosphatase)
MRIALFADPERARGVAARLEARGHACIASRGSIPGGADCLVVVGDAGGDEGLVAEAEKAGMPVLRIPAERCAEAAEAAAWGLGLADERFVRANRQLMDELNLASELQKSLLPRAYPSDAPLEFAHKFVPLNSVGGDFFDVVRIDERNLALVIADVSGHGVGPALVTAMFKSSFGLVCRMRSSPAALMKSLNAEMNAFLTTGHYVTAFAAFIDLESLEMRYCSAGHPNQILARAGGVAEELGTMGFLLGMIEDVEFEEKSLVLAPGDTLVLFTDGVFESLDASGRPFGREGILRSIGARPGAGPGELSAGLFSDLLEWTQGTEAEDDLTILMAQVLESLQPDEA